MNETSSSLAALDPTLAYPLAMTSDAQRIFRVCVTFRAGRNRFGTLTLRKHSRIQREGSLRKI